MAPTRRTVLGMAAMTVGLSGCTGGGGDGNGGSTTTEPETATSTPTETEAAGVAVQVSDRPDLGEILVDGDGMTLYMFDADERGAGASSCTDGCAEAWPPLTTDGAPSQGARVTAELSTFERADGSTQVAAAGLPLYYFASDEAPGDATGPGVSDVWWALRPGGTPVRPDAGTGATVQVREHPDLGEILVDADGMTLYMFDSDEQGAGASSCSGGCADTWPPLTLDDEPTAGEGVSAELSSFERGDGETQAAANGWPLYYYVSDSDPGDASGQGVGDVWWVLDPSGTPVRGGAAEEASGSSDGGGGLY